MILIFDPSLSYLRWAKINSRMPRPKKQRLSGIDTEPFQPPVLNPGNLCGERIKSGLFSEGRCRLEPGRLERIARDKSGEGPEAIGYLLYHGGDIIKNPVEEISFDSLGKIGECVKFLPEYNDITFKVIKYCLKRFPKAKHLLLCDTAFFVDLPPEVSTYAVPYELRKKGVRRYGGQGLLHQWAWDKVKASAETKVSKAISVYLGDYSNMVAVKDGLPRETSMGFTSVEGIISAVSCGDIDPTVIFQLYSTGMSFEAINRLLSKESGFTALLGRKAGFSDLLAVKRGPKEIALSKIYCYNILKYLGGFTSALGGADALIFTGEEIKCSIPLVRRICGNLGFLGLKLKPRHTAGKGVISLTEENSTIRVFCLEYEKWGVLAQRLKEGLK